MHLAGRYRRTLGPARERRAGWQNMSKKVCPSKDSILCCFQAFFVVVSLVLRWCSVCISRSITTASDQLRLWASAYRPSLVPTVGNLIYSKHATSSALGVFGVFLAMMISSGFPSPLHLPSFTAGSGGSVVIKSPLQLKSPRFVLQHILCIFSAVLVTGCPF